MWLCSILILKEKLVQELRFGLGLKPYQIDVTSYATQKKGLRLINNYLNMYNIF